MTDHTSKPVSFPPAAQDAPFPLGRPGFVSHPIDRAAHLRSDPDRLRALEQSAEAGVYVVHKDALLLKQTPQGPRALLTVAEARAFGAQGDLFFLGLENTAAIFGVGLDAEAAERLTGRADIVLENLRMLASEGRVEENALSTIAMAKSLAGWHQRHRFCANCGSPTQITQAGWRRDCPACHAEHFPRTDPVVIMMVTSGERCLLGRQPHFAPMMWSCLAGFVEAAETIEDAVRREVFEEAHIACTDVRYYASQPWPYPSSLMIGCTARATSHDIVIDRSELEDARWFDRDDVIAMLQRNHRQGFIGPHPVAIAHHLLRQWIAQPSGL